MSGQENGEALSAQENEAAQVKNLRDRLRDSHYRGKLLHTFYLALAFVSLGLVVGQSGPTFLDLQIITNTDIEKASAFFTAGSVGYLLGSVIAGAIYNKVNRNLMMFAGTLGLGITSFTTPYCELYGLMIFIKFSGTIASGVVDTTGNSEQMRIWGSEGDVLMQLLHFAFALGGVISPLYTEPFLAERGNETEEDKPFVGKLNFSYEAHVNFTNTSVFVPEEDSLTRETNVHYAFLITAVFCVIMSLPFLALFIKEKVRKKEQKTNHEDKRPQRKLPLSLFLFLLIMLCLFYAVYCCVEDTFASFLMTFLVREYDYVSKSQGAYITAIYWASFAASRFLMIFVAKVLTSVQLLSLCCGIMTAAFISFIVSAVFGSVVALSIFAAVAGLGMSAIFPAGFSWTERELLRVTGRVSSCILVSASVGTMFNPLFLAFLMEEVSNMWFCYLLIGQTLLVCCIFIFLFCFNRGYVNKHYGPVRPAAEITTEVEAEETQKPLRRGTTDEAELKI